MNILISGGTGLIGSALIDNLLQAGHHISCVTRTPSRYPSRENIHYISWEELQLETISNQTDAIDVIINLAGESIGSGRWTSEKKAQIQNSRTQAGKALSSFAVKQNPQPKLFIQASAIGIYGVDELDKKDESSKPGNDYLSSVAVAWEEASAAVEKAGIPRAIIRMGVVLDRDQGALPRMLLPFKLFAGGPLGSGKQWISWIHLEDVVQGIVFILNQNKSGKFNLVSPNPVRNRDFGITIARIIQKPYWIPTPAWALRLVLGEMSTLVLDGQKVLPTRLQEEGFSFRYAELSDALQELLDS